MSGFICPYHGWAYSITGDLVGVTHPRGYPEEILSQASVGCKNVGWQCIGLIFAKP